jgi:hypothetical protein
VEQRPPSEANILSVVTKFSAFSTTGEIHVRFQVLAAETIKMVVFWVVAPYSLVEIYRRFRDACCLHHQGYLHHYPDDGGRKHL